ncbi:MAG: cell wall anchor protein, partial [Smithella sp.]
MKRKAKKILSLLLTASLILTMLPSTAFASVKASASNTAAQNSEILTQLSGLTGGDSDEAYGLLNDLGLLDEDGNLDVNQSILLDGRSMTLDEVMALLEDPSTDLSRVADVDGVPIALGDLKTMIQIEQELTRIKATYFSGKTFTKEQLASLDDLMNEIQTEGITAKSLDLQSTQSSGLVLTVTPDPDNPTDLTYSGAPITLVYTLALSGTMPSQGTVGFSWRTVSGLDFFGVELKAETTVFNMLRYQYSRGTFTFGVEGSGADFLVNDPSNFTGTLTVMIGKTSGGLEYSIEELLGCNVLGRLRGFVEFYDGDGVSFSDGSSLSGLYTIPVELSKPDAFEDGTTWTTSMDGLSDHDRTVSSPDDLGYNEKLNPRWDLIDQNDTEMKADYLTLKKTANEIFGGGPCYYQTNARLYIYDPGVISSGYMNYAMPLPVGSTDFSSGDLIQYQWTNSVNGPSGPLYNLLLESDPLRCDTGSILYPYIPISKTINAAEARYVSVVMSYSDGFPPLKMTTIWPKNPTFSTGPGNEDGDISLTNAAKQYTVSSSLSVYDKDAPTVKSVDIPAGIYSTGQYVPITLTFSEPVDASELSLSINGSLTAANELLMDTEGSKAVAMYRVKDVDGTEINISSITNIKDLMGNKTPTDNHGGAGWTFSDVELKSTLMKNAVTGISVIPATLQSADIADGVTVKLTLKQAAAYIGAYTDYNNKKRKAPFAVQLTKNGTVVERLDTTLNDTGGTFSASAQITGFSVATADKTYTAEVIAYESDTDTTGTLVLGKSADFTVKALIYVDGVTVTYPADNKQQLSLAESYRPKLGVAFANNPTYTTGTWISGDPEIATIAADGQVSLTGSKIGYVHFTFTADDGGLASTSDRDPNPKHVKDATSMDYEVVAGGIPSLVIPGETNRFTVRLGSDAEVRWSSNVNFSATDDFDYTIELFEGNFSEFQLGGKTVQYSATAAKNENSAVIPYSELTTLSVNGAPAYTVRISAPDPLITGATISALCYIVVNPLAAVVHLQRPASLYMLDDGALYINWTIDNFTRDRTDADLLIKKISTDANGNDISTTYLGVGDWPIDAASDSYWLKPDPVTGLKDTYMVTLQARNPGDAGYSADSFVLYVYHDGALQLEVAGQKGMELSLRMDNESKVSGTLPTDTADIMELREELALIEYVGINYHDYSWSQLKDGIKWSSSDADTLRVNYRQGGLYEDISKFSMDTYLPETKMALSSVTDGTALITATHANTGMQASAEVEVKTLREKFYLFRLSPAQQTELTYMDGKGVQKTVRTNSEGVLALYEPDGIDSDVQLKAVNGGSVWLGTIYQSSLLSGERDATRLQLYPLNAFKLRQAAKVEIHLQKPDGSPYTGSVTLRGGVYKNDGYCQDARMLGNMVPDAGHPLKDGKSAQSVVIGPDGKLTVYMDSTQFWSQANGETDAAGASLQSTDNLQYLFELTDMSGYFPLLVFANGNLGFNDLMRSAGSVISLESCATGSPRPFVSNQTVDYGLSGSRLIDVRGSTGHIGPNDTYPQVNLLTTVLLWGQDVQKTYQLQICDEFGYVPAAQSSQIVTYPFSSIPVIRNTLVMSNDTISKSGWVAAGKDVGLRVRLAQEGAMLMELPLSSRLTDLTQVPKLKDTGDITGLMLDLQGKSGLGAGAQMSDGNKIINGLMGLMGKISGPVDGSNFKMLITPGDDNAVFNAFIWAGYNSLGLDEVDYDQNGLAFDYQLAESNLSTAPSLNSLTEMARGSYDPTQTYDEGKANQGRGKGTGSTDFGGQLEGYFEAQIQYNFDAGKWEIYLLGGGTTAGFGASYTYNVNGQAGPVPLTATFTVGGAIQLDFKVAARYSEKSGYEWADTVTGNAVNDYLTTLRINAYVNAFGGIGFDYSVVALKIGLFGKLGVDNQNKFLSRTYLADTTLRQLNGQAIQLSGEVGIKFVAQFLFISYDLVLASGSLAYTRQFNEWDSITDYWNNTGSGLRMLMVNAAQNDLVPVSSSATLQSRDYLEEFARSWGVKNRVSLMALDSPNALATLQTNAYPYSLPLVTGDGELLLYAFDGDSADVGDTRIYATNQSGGSYP